MDKWAICNKKGDFEGISEKFGLSAVSSRLLVNRDIVEADKIREFFEPDISMLQSPFLLKDMDRAAALIADRIEKGVAVRVVGDYDVDGIMATYILTDAIRSCGGRADWYIPHRIKDGYGINPEIIDTAKADGIDTVVTCDNGIAAFDAALEAKKVGITMVITDHHELQEKLPDCDIIVDPKQKDDNYPCKDVCGAVVAAKLAEALFERCGHDFDVTRYLEFMAMATVCDVVSLTFENRAIVKLGLRKMINTANPGLAALMSGKGIDPENINEYHVGFMLGPCFNAAGRIDDASVALNMLTQTDEGKAAELAEECIRLNEERKAMTADQEKNAVQKVESFGHLPKVIVIELEGCHESILGIIAGRLKERYSRPTIVAVKNPDGYKASARSTENYNIFEELKKCADLLVKFGGHPMAAGLTIRENCFDELFRRLNENCLIGEEDMCKKILLDAEVSFNAFDEKTLGELALFAPFGQGNPAPLFAERDLKVRSISYIGKDNSFLKFTLVNSRGRRITATLFSNVENVLCEIENRFGKDEITKAFNGAENSISLTAAYVPKLNVFHDNRDIQMNIKYIRV